MYILYGAAVYDIPEIFPVRPDIVVENLVNLQTPQEPFLPVFAPDYQWTRITADIAILTGPVAFK